MPRRYYSSTAQRTTLASSCSNSDTTLSVTAVSGWPSSFPYTICIDQDTINEELVSVTARSGTTLTVTRGIDGTAAVAHSAGATVNHAVSAQDFNEPNQFLNEGGTVAGPTLVTANSSSTALEVRQTGAGNALVVEDSTNPDSSPIVVNADGQFIVGDTTIRTINSATNHTVQIGGGAARVTVTRYDNGANSSALWLNKSRSTTPGSFVAVQNGDGVGSIYFHADDGTDLNNRVAAIDAFIDGAPGTDDTPGRLVFSTTADGASTPTERMRITNAGNVGIGTSSPLERLTISAGNVGFNRYANNVNMYFRRASGTEASPTIVSSGDNLGAIAFLGHDGTSYQNAASIAAYVDATPGSSDMPGRLTFWTTADGASSSTERMRITNAGNVGIGGTPPENAARLFVASEAAFGGTFIRNARDGVDHGSLFFDSARGTLASPTVVSSGDTLGTVVFRGYDGAAWRNAALISVAVDTTPGSGDMPGRLTFSTTPDGSTTLTERMRIDSAGNVGIGTAPSFRLETYDASSNIAMVRGDSGTALFLRRGSADANGPDLNFNKARNTSGSPQSVSASDVLGNLVWRGHDGTQYVAGAAIIATVDGTPGTNDMPGRLTFSTTPDGSATLTERMRIDNAGLITGSGTSLGAWTSYTPTLGGTGWAIGNGTATGYYCRIGKVVHFRASITLGSTSTAGAGSPEISYPLGMITGVNLLIINSTGQVVDASTANVYYGAFAHIDATKCKINSIGTNGLHGSLGGLFTFAESDVLRISATYEIA